MSHAISHRHLHSMHSDRWETFEDARAEYERFLKSCEAIPCTVQMYAKWLSVYLEEGGKVMDYSYDLRGGRWYIATKSTDLPIPTGYGASSIHLLVLSRIVHIPLTPTSWDHRAGWEWGHSEVYILTSKRTKRAWTNEPYSVPCYTNVVPHLSPRAKAMLEAQREAKKRKQFHCYENRDIEDYGFSYRRIEQSCLKPVKAEPITPPPVQKLETVNEKVKTVENKPKVKKEKPKSPHQLAVEEINAINARYNGALPISTRQGLKISRTVILTAAQIARVAVITLFILALLVIGLAILL